MNNPQSQNRQEDFSSDRVERAVLKVLATGNKPNEGNTVTQQTAAVRPQLATLLTDDRLERLSTLRPHFLEINSDHPENSPDLIALEKLYTDNLVPDAAFLRLLEGDHVSFSRAMERGGMLNRFSPSDTEMSAYPSGYESVKNQIITDLLGTSERPGVYKILGLSDAEGILRASLSYRHPVPHNHPDYHHEMARYIAYLDKTLCNDPSDTLTPPLMSYSAQWDVKRMKQEFSSMWEIDTFNVEKGWGGAGYLLVRQALEDIKASLGELPKAVFCYRYDGIRIQENSEAGGQWELVGPNRGSRNFLEDLGFNRMAERTSQDEIMVREIAGEICIFTPQWSYHYCGRNRLQQNLQSCMHAAGLLK